MKVEVEIVDANLNYNTLLGRSWTHAMHVIASSLFRMIHFPHQGNIVIGEQLSLFSSSSSNGNVSYIKRTGTPYESVGASLFKYSSLMGIVFSHLLIFPLSKSEVVKDNFAFSCLVV